MVRRGNGGDGVVVTSEDSGAISLSNWSGGNYEQSRRASMQGMGAAAQQAPSPRLSAAGKRLAEEKSWLSDLPEYCFAEPTRGSDFVWSFRVSGLQGTSYQEVGKVSFRAHFPRDYPQTPPTLLLTDELVHPNWKYPARGLEIPDLTKERWDPSMTIPKMLVHLRDIIRGPDISALGLMWREGAGQLPDGGVTLGATGNDAASGSKTQAERDRTSGQRDNVEGENAPSFTVSGPGDRSSGATGADAGAGERVGDVAGPKSEGAIVNSSLRADPPPSTAAEWTATRKGIDGELALLYLLDTSSFRTLIVKHQQHLGLHVSHNGPANLPLPGGRGTHVGGSGSVVGASGGPGGGVGTLPGANAAGGLGAAVGNPGGVGVDGAGMGVRGHGSSGKGRRLKPLQGLGSFVSRKVGGGPRGGSGMARKSLLGGGKSGGGGGGVEGFDDAMDLASNLPGLGRSGGNRRSSGGVGELSVKAVEKLRRSGSSRMPSGITWGGSPGGPAALSPGIAGGRGIVGMGWRNDSWAGPASSGSPLRPAEDPMDSSIPDDHRSDKALRVLGLAPSSETAGAISSTGYHGHGYGHGGFSGASQSARGLSRLRSYRPPSYASHERHYPPQLPVLQPRRHSSGTTPSLGRPSATVSMTVTEPLSPKTPMRGVKKKGDRKRGSGNSSRGTREVTNTESSATGMRGVSVGAGWRVGGVFSKDHRGHDIDHAGERAASLYAPRVGDGEDDSDSGSTVSASRTAEDSMSGSVRPGGDTNADGKESSPSPAITAHTPVDDEETETAVAAAAASAASRAAKGDGGNGKRSALAEDSSQGLLPTNKQRNTVEFRISEDSPWKGSSRASMGSTGLSASDGEDLASDPPVLPSGELLEEGSKAWKLLGPGPAYATPHRSRSATISASVGASAPRVRRGRQSLPPPAGSRDRGDRHSLPPGQLAGSVPEPNRSKSMSNFGARGRRPGVTRDDHGELGRPEPLALTSADLMDHAPLGRAPRGSARGSGSVPYWSGTRTLAAESQGWGTEGTVSLGAQTPPPGAGGEDTALGQLLGLSTPPRPGAMMELGLGMQTPPPGSSDPFAMAVPRVMGDEIDADGDTMSSSAAGSGGMDRDVFGSRGALAEGDAEKAGGVKNAAVRKRPSRPSEGGGISPKEGDVTSATSSRPSSSHGVSYDDSGIDRRDSGSSQSISGRSTGGSGRVSRSAASTPKGSRSNSWQTENRDEDLRLLGSKTPGRLPRRLHQGMNKVKRAVGVGDMTPYTGQVGPPSTYSFPAAATVKTPRQQGPARKGDGTAGVSNIPPPLALPVGSAGSGSPRRGPSSFVSSPAMSLLGSGSEAGAGSLGLDIDGVRAEVGRSGLGECDVSAANSVGDSVGGSGDYQPKVHKATRGVHHECAVPSDPETDSGLAPVGAVTKTGASLLPAVSGGADPVGMASRGLAVLPPRGRNSGGGSEELNGTAGQQQQEQQQHQQQQQQHAHSLRERHGKLVRVLGEESSEQIWEEMTRSAHSTPSQHQGSDFGSRGGGSSSIITAAVSATTSSSPSSLVAGGRKHSRRSASASGTELLGLMASAGCPSPRWATKGDANGSLSYRGSGGIIPRATMGLTSLEKGFGSNGSGGVPVGSICGGGPGGGDGGGGGGCVVIKSGKATKFPYRKRLREGLDTAYQNRGMLFCMQEAILYVRGKDPICPGHRPRWWPEPGGDSPQIRASLVGGRYEGRCIAPASLQPWQMRLNLFGSRSRSVEDHVGLGMEAEDSPVRADGMRVPQMMLLPLGALRSRVPEFREKKTVPVSCIPKDAVVVWVSHCWMGTPSRPDDQANSKAKALHEGLRRLESDNVYVWVDSACLPDNAGPKRSEDSTTLKGQAIMEAVAAADEDIPVAQTEAKMAEEAGPRARTIRALPLYLLCCDYFLALDEQESTYWCSPWTRLERAALREAVTLTSGGGSTKADRTGHPQLLHMQRDEVSTFMGLGRRSKAFISRATNSLVTAPGRSELVSPFGQGSKAGASGISAADVPAIRRSYQLLEGFMLARTKLARYPCMDVPRLDPRAELEDKPIHRDFVSIPGFSPAAAVASKNDGSLYPAEREASSPARNIPLLLATTSAPLPQTDTLPGSKGTEAVTRGRREGVRSGNAAEGETSRVTTKSLRTATSLPSRPISSTRIPPEDDNYALGRDSNEDFGMGPRELSAGGISGDSGVDAGGDIGRGFQVGRQGDGSGARGAGSHVVSVVDPTESEEGNVEGGTSEMDGGEAANGSQGSAAWRRGVGEARQLATYAGRGPNALPSPAPARPVSDRFAIPSTSSGSLTPASMNETPGFPSSGSPFSPTFSSAPGLDEATLERRRNIGLRMALKSIRVVGREDLDFQQLMGSPGVPDTDDSRGVADTPPSVASESLASSRGHLRSHRSMSDFTTPREAHEHGDEDGDDKDSDSRLRSDSDVGGEDDDAPPPPTELTMTRNRIRRITVQPSTSPTLPPAMESVPLRHMAWSPQEPPRAAGVRPVGTGGTSDTDEGRWGRKVTSRRRQGFPLRDKPPAVTGALRLGGNAGEEGARLGARGLNVSGGDGSTQATVSNLGNRGAGVVMTPVDSNSASFAAPRGRRPSSGTGRGGHGGIGGGPRNIWGSQREMDDGGLNDGSAAEGVDHEAGGVQGRNKQPQLEMVSPAVVERMGGDDSREQGDGEEGEDFGETMEGAKNPQGYAEDDGLDEEDEGSLGPGVNGAGDEMDEGEPSGDLGMDEEGSAVPTLDRLPALVTPTHLDTEYLRSSFRSVDGCASDITETPSISERVKAFGSGSSVCFNTSRRRNFGAAAAIIAVAGSPGTARVNDWLRRLPSSSSPTVRSGGGGGVGIGIGGAGGMGDGERDVRVDGERVDETQKESLTPTTVTASNGSTNMSTNTASTSTNSTSSSASASVDSPQGDSAGSGGGGFSRGGRGLRGTAGGTRAVARPPPSPAGGSAQGGGAPPLRSSWDSRSAGASSNQVPAADSPSTGGSALSRSSPDEDDNAAPESDDTFHAVKADDSSAEAKAARFKALRSIFDQKPGSVVVPGMVGASHYRRPVKRS